MNTPLRECVNCGMSLRICFIRHTNIGWHCCADCIHDSVVKEMEIS